MRNRSAHQTIVNLSVQCSEFLLVTQNVDDLHLRLGREVVVRQKWCRFMATFSLRAVRGAISEDYEHEQLTTVVYPKCPECGALMRPGVVWFGEQLDLAKIGTVENFVTGGDCDLVIVAGTTALFGYIIDWALRARGHTGQLIEVNPEETSLSQFATKSVPRTGGVALPRLVNELLRNFSA